MNASDLACSAATEAAPPAGLSISARALWFAKAGHWDTAHDLCQNIPGNAGAWIHAHLHREEGDPSNAAYWYQQANKPFPPAKQSLSDEWLEIAGELLL